MEPYRSAARVFWIVDNGSSHRGKKAARRLRERYPNLILVHTPTHASWLNQVEVFFGITQRKVLTPAVANSLEELAARILAFEAQYRRQPRPFAGSSRDRSSTGASKSSSSAPSHSPHDPLRTCGQDH